MALSLFGELKRRNVFKATTAYLVLAWVVIQVTAEAVPALGLPDWVNTLVFFMGAMGLPFVILFSWAFELTPEGVKKEADVDRTNSIATKTGQKLNFVIIGLLVVAIGLLLFDKGTADSPAAIVTENVETTNTIVSDKASIAVLPFLNMSNDADQEFFSDGITEELLNVLAKIPKFEVASRTSSFKYKGTQESIPYIANELKVRYIVEGSVRKAGETIRITAQLIDSTNDRHLWSDTFDRPLTADNIFVIQDEISNNIVTALSTELGLKDVIQVQTTHTTDNLSSYEKYLQARSIQLTRKDLELAEGLLNKAIEQDPNYADAIGLAAANYALMAIYGSPSELTADELRQKSNEYARRTISLDPKSANAYAVLGLNKQMAGFDGSKVNWTKVFEFYEKAIELNPKNPQALNWLAVGKMMLGYLDYAKELFQQCIQAEPGYSSCHVNLWMIISALGDDKAALKHFEKVLDVGGLDITEYAPMHIYARLNMSIPFKVAAIREDAFEGWGKLNQLYLAHKNLESDHSGLLAEALKFLGTKLKVDDRLGFFAFRQTSMLMPLGYFERFPFQYSWEPSYKKYRQSPQFKEAMKSRGVLTHWQEVGFPKQCQPVGEDDFKCD